MFTINILKYTKYFYKKKCKKIFLGTGEYIFKTREHCIRLLQLNYVKTLNTQTCLLLSLIPQLIILFILMQKLLILIFKLFFNQDIGSFKQNLKKSSKLKKK